MESIGESEARKQVWLKQYPRNVERDIDLKRFNSIPDVLENAVKRFGKSPAFTNMDVTMTFEEVGKAVEQFASFLEHELHLRKGDRIAIQMPNLLQFPVVAFAALRLGLIVVNTNPLYTAKEMRHQFKDSGAKAIVILANYAHLLEEVIKDTKIESVVVTEVGDLFPVPKRLVVNSVVRFVKKMVPKFKIKQAYRFTQAMQIGAMRRSHRAALSQTDLAFLQYTGGTTGVAKGAMLTHANVIANMLQIFEWMKPRLIEGQEMVITALPMYHIFSLTVNALALMTYGGHNILITNPRDIPGFIKELKKHPFTVMTGVNTLFNALMNDPGFNSIDFSKVKVSVAGAMSLQTPVAERWKSLTKSLIIEGYGLTEASPVVCANPIDGNDRMGHIGLPLPSTDVILLDDDNKPVAKGQPGELCVRGPQVMQGYWNQPEETAKVLIDGWLHTGDVAILDDDGYFKIVDRKKDMILVSGFNVYPNEVEEAIASHEKVLEVAAIGLPDESSGEVVKVVIVKKDASLTADEVIAHARKSLTGYKVPKSVEFRTELPKTAVGKILRRALRSTPQASA